MRGTKLERILSEKKVLSRFLKKSPRVHFLRFSFDFLHTVRRGISVPLLKISCKSNKERRVRSEPPKKRETAPGLRLVKIGTNYLLTSSFVLVKPGYHFTITITNLM